MNDHAFESLTCTVRKSRIEPEKPSLYGEKRLKIKMPDVPIVVWVDEQSKSNWTAGFPGYRMREAFAKAKSKDLLIEKLKKRWWTVGPLGNRLVVTD